MADYDDLTEGQLVETTAHINGWQKIRRLMFGSNRLDSLDDGDQLYMKTGTYTGDGNPTKAVTGVGFQPRFLWIFSQVDATGTIGRKTDQDGTSSGYSTSDYETDYIISLDSDGFTVGDGTGGTGGNVFNVNARSYAYVAFR